MPLNYNYVHIHMHKPLHYVINDLFNKHSRQSDGRLPDIIWCREPFFEDLNQIEDIND